MKSLKEKLFRLGFNVFPPYFGTGASIEYIAPDFHEVRIKLPLSWRTRNVVGTTFGGSMYAAVDPVYMMMLMRILGPEYVVWDKAACIRFRKPGRGTLYARFVISPDEVEAVKAGLLNSASLDRVYYVDLVDRQGTVHATVEKTLYVRRKNGVIQEKTA
jgi:acyl-coenzyme A thioesterase PaaI-like protein